MTRFPLAACVLPAPAKNAPRTVQDGEYIHEILGHAGLGYDRVELDGLADALAQGSGCRLLLTVGEHPFPFELSIALTAWVAAGGAWISIGGVCGMDGLLGAKAAAPSYVLWAGGARSLGEGYLAADGEHAALNGLARPLHYFGGAAVVATTAAVFAMCLDAHGRPTELPAMLERRVGAGRTLLIAPDVTGAIVRIQQGTAITRDGVPAGDGTGPVNDGVLKSDDGQALDWLLDRDEVPGAPGLRAFLHPAADAWRDLLLRALFNLAESQGVSLPLLWYYPDNLPALGHLSHDTDGNSEPCARRLLETLAEAGVRSTWCVILPGYGPETMRAIRDAGHELATHFDAMTDGCPWGEAHFDRQWRELCALFGSQPVTNKNHYLRWEGDVELFQWCIARGIRLDQSKGASKTGEAGFNFGTCHPYRPVAADGSVLPILELPTPTQDLLVFAPECLVEPLLEAAVMHHGILHLLFHPAHIEKPGVANSLVRAVRAGEARGLRWRTAAEIAAWEDGRREARWRCDAGGFTLTAGERSPLPAATLLVSAPVPTGSVGAGPSPGARPTQDNPAPCDPGDPSQAGPAGALDSLVINGETVAALAVERWGARFYAVTRDIAAGETVRLEVTK